MHCNHSKSFNRNFISMQPTDCSKECLLQAAGEVLTLLTGRTCPAGQVTLAGGDVVPRYNTISTMCTPRAMARGCLTTIWQIQRYSPAGGDRTAGVSLVVNKNSLLCTFREDIERISLLSVLKGFTCNMTVCC